MVGQEMEVGGGAVRCREDVYMDRAPFSTTR